MDQIGPLLLEARLPTLPPSLRWLPAVAGLLALGAQVWWWWPYVSDDAFISLRYADRLLLGAGLTWGGPGPAVEGYSNLLWVLLCALLGAAGADLLWSARVLGLLCAAGAVVLAAVSSRGRPSAGLAAAVALGSSGTVGLWAIGGLEQPLLLLLITAAVASLSRRLSVPERSTWETLPAALCLALACWCRPDTPLLVACLSLGFWLARGQDRAALAPAMVLAGVPAAAVLAQLGLRLWLYGDVVPNTAHIKAHSGPLIVDQGVLYVWQAVRSNRALLGLAALGAFWAPPGEPPRARLRLLLPALLAWPAYLIWIGGDIFPAFRHATPLLPMLAALVAAGVAGMPARARPIAALAAVLLLVGQAIRQTDADAYKRAHNEGWVLHGLSVGEALDRLFADHPSPPRLAIAAAGAVPYGAAGLPALDVLGLNDHHIARQPPSPNGWIGHAHGDPDYVLAQAPDLIFFCGPRGGAQPCFPPEVQLSKMAGFQQRWRLAAFLADDGTPFRPWARQDSPALGPDGGRWPAWWFAPPEDRGVGADGLLRLEADESATLTLDAPVASATLEGTAARIEVHDRAVVVWGPAALRGVVVSPP